MPSSSFERTAQLYNAVVALGLGAFAVLTSVTSARALGAGSIWTIGHWRRIAEERANEIGRLGAEMERINAERDAALQDVSSARLELAAIKNSLWWKARTQAVSLARRARGW